MIYHTAAKDYRGGACRPVIGRKTVGEDTSDIGVLNEIAENSKITGVE